MKKKKVALVLGSFLGLLHLCWGILIAFGFAQPLLDFVFKMHSLNNPFTIGEFDLMRSLGLVILTFLVGYAFGYAFVTLWNKFHR